MTDMIEFNRRGAVVVQSQAHKLMQACLCSFNTEMLTFDTPQVINSLKMNELRKSCGVAPKAITFRRPVPYGST